MNEETLEETDIAREVERINHRLCSSRMEGDLDFQGKIETEHLNVEDFGDHYGKTCLYENAGNLYIQFKFTSNEQANKVLSDIYNESKYDNFSEVSIRNPASEFYYVTFECTKPSL